MDINRNIEVCPESLLAMSEYWCIEHGLLALTLSFCKNHWLEYGGGFQLLGLLILYTWRWPVYFEKEINKTQNSYGNDRLNTVVIMFQAYVSCHHEDDKMIVFERGSLLWVFNFHSTKSFADYRVGVSIAGKYPLSQLDKFEFTVFAYL